MFTATFAFLFALSTTTTQVNLEEAYVKSRIELTAMEFGLDNARIKFIEDVVKCESSFKKHALGDNGKAYSYFQFHKPTFEMFKKEWGHHWLDYSNPEDHIKLGVYSFYKGYDSHWSCASIVNKRYQKIALK